LDADIVSPHCGARIATAFIVYPIAQFSGLGEVPKFALFDARGGAVDE
jgi:hypothetical protein